MNEKKITKADFVQWRNEEVTTEIFNALQGTEKFIQDILTSEEHLLSKDVRVKSARLYGQLEGIRMLLNIHVDEVVEEASNE